MTNAAAAADVRIRVLGPGDERVLESVAPDVFDQPVDAIWTARFLSDPRHHLVVAIDGDLVVGFASAIDYLHPDKPPTLWINEVGVAPTHQRRGIGRLLTLAILDRGRVAGCLEAWVGTETSNEPARRLYQTVGGVEAKDGFVMVEFRLRDQAERPPDELGWRRSPVSTSPVSGELDASSARRPGAEGEQSEAEAEAKRDQG